MDGAYLSTVKPFGLLRTWIGSTQWRTNKIHQIDLSLDFLLANANIKSQKLSTTFNEGINYEETLETSMFLGQLNGFDQLR